MRRFVFWTSATVITYVYVLFPVLLALRGLVVRRPVRDAAIEPSISVVIAARNEELTIGEKLVNLAELDYPSDRLEVIIASDGSTDRTAAIVRDFMAQAAGGPTIRLLDLPPSGKAVAVTRAVESATGSVLVFSDANSIYAPGALRALVRPLADPEIGGVAGNQVYRHPDRPGEDAGERRYWSYDRLLKILESRAGNVIGGTGAIYAIRRPLFRPIPAGVNDDFFETAGVIEQGYRLVFAPDAVAYEPPASRMEAEFARKVRVVSRAMRCVVELRALLDPRRHGFYAIQLLSHKILRWAVGVPLVALLVSSALLVRRGPFYVLALVAQCLFYALAAVGTMRRSSPKGSHPLLSIPAYFVMVNLAALRAAWNLITDRRIDRWDPARASNGEREDAAAA